MRSDATRRRGRRRIAGFGALAVFAALAVAHDAGAQGKANASSIENSELEPVRDPRIANRVAAFSGIDKITGRTSAFDVYIGETVQFGALQVTPRVCYSRDKKQKPKTTTFVEVDEVTLDGGLRRIFTGWMFADSPGLNAVDHAVYDVWLKDCKMESDIPPPA